MDEGMKKPVKLREVKVLWLGYAGAQPSMCLGIYCALLVAWLVGPQVPFFK